MSANDTRRWSPATTFGLLAALTFGTLAGAFIWVWLDTEALEAKTSPQAEPTPHAIPAREAADQTRRVAPTNDSAGWEDIYGLCSPLAEPMAHRLSARGGLTPACEAALDRQLLDTSPSHMPIAASDGSLYWREVFSSPLEKRDRAERTLLTRSCANAGADCDLDALASFGVLKYQCAGKRYEMLRHIEAGIHEVVERAGLGDLADNTVYWQRRTEVEKGYYRAAWLAAKCAAIPQGVLASFVPEGRNSAFPSRDPRLKPKISNTAPVGHEPAPGQEGWWWAEQAWEAYQLMTYAAGLDQIHRAGRLTGSPYKYGAPEPNSWQRDDPLLAEIVQLKWWKNPGPGDHRNARLVHAFLAATWATAQGVVLDRQWLARQVGPPVSHEEWQHVRPRAERHLKAQGRNVLSIDSPSVQ